MDNDTDTVKSATNPDSVQRPEGTRQARREALQAAITHCKGNGDGGYVVRVADTFEKYLREGSQA